MAASSRVWGRPMVRPLAVPWNQLPPVPGGKATSLPHLQPRGACEGQASPSAQPVGASLQAVGGQAVPRRHPHPGDFLFQHQSSGSPAPSIHVLATSEPDGDTDLPGHSRGHSRGRTATCPPQGPWRWPPLTHTATHSRPITGTPGPSSSQPASCFHSLAPAQAPGIPIPRTHPCTGDQNIPRQRPWTPRGSKRTWWREPGTSLQAGRGRGTVLPLTPLRVSQRTAELLTLWAQQPSSSG